MKIDFKSRLKFVNSIGFKVSLIYISLAVINIVFFTSVIFENQVELITDNARLQAEKYVSTITASLKKIAKTSPDRTNNDRQNEYNAIEEINRTLKPLVNDYCIFSESGDIIYKTGNEAALPDSYIQDGIKSVAEQDFTGSSYYLKINEKEYKMYFYLPLQEYARSNSILFINYDIMEIGNRLTELFRQALLIFMITVLFHVLFAVLIYKIIVKPIHRLHDGIREIADGKFSTRLVIPGKDEIGMVAGAFNKMAQTLQENIDTIEKQMNTIQELAITDELTGLFNRRYLFRRLEDEIKRTIRRDYDLSFMMIDIDHFKNFNDTYGHITGDLVLKEVARVIQYSCKETDIVARYGGEEIAVMALDCPMEDLLTMAERIRSRVEETMVDTVSGPLSVTVSLGVTCFSSTLRETIGNAESLVYFADTALYRAKEKGRNRVEVG